MTTTKYIAKNGKLILQESESGEGRQCFRLLVGEITDALNYREFEVTIFGQKDIDIDVDLMRYLAREMAIHNKSNLFHCTGS